MKQLFHSAALLSLIAGITLAAAHPASTSATSAMASEATTLRGGCKEPGEEKYCTTPPNIYSHCGAVLDVNNDCDTSRQFEEITSQWDSECVAATANGAWLECRLWDRPACLKFSKCKKETDEFGIDHCIPTENTSRIGSHVKHIETDNFYYDCPLPGGGSSSGS